MGSSCVRQRMAASGESPLKATEAILTHHGKEKFSAGGDDEPLASTLIQGEGEGNSVRGFTDSLPAIVDVRGLVEGDACVHVHRVAATSCDPLRHLQPVTDTTLVSAADAADRQLCVQNHPSLPPQYASLRAESVLSFAATPRSLRTVRTHSVSGLSPARSQDPFFLTAPRFTEMEQECSEAFVDNQYAGRCASLSAFCDDELQQLQQQRCLESHGLHDDASTDDVMSQGRCPAAFGSVLDSLESVAIAVGIDGKPSCSGCSSFSTDCGLHSTERSQHDRTCGSRTTPRHHAGLLETRFRLPMFREREQSVCPGVIKKKS